MKLIENEEQQNRNQSGWRKLERMITTKEGKRYFDRLRHMIRKQKLEQNIHYHTKNLNRRLGIQMHMSPNPRTVSILNDNLNVMNL